MVFVIKRNQKPEHQSFEDLSYYTHIVYIYVVRLLNIFLNTFKFILLLFMSLRCTHIQVNVSLSKSSGSCPLHYSGTARKSTCNAVPCFLIIQCWWDTEYFLLLNNKTNILPGQKFRMIGKAMFLVLQH